ncbi:MAG: cytochrome c [Deltaproteobacteria bacterium]|nr:cytochrome c [Deltaproteobacteria bacterium]
MAITFEKYILTATVAAIFVFAAVVSANADGRGVFEAKGCASCHITKGPDTAKTVEDLVKAKGPELWYSGSKYKEGFLEKWLAKPLPIRPMAYYSLEKKNPGNHPSLSAEDAKSVAVYLMTLKAPNVSRGTIKPENSRQGRAVFEKKFGCYGCHLLIKEGSEIGGLSGPSLVGASKRYNPDWVFEYLKNPKRFKSVMTMPVSAGTDAEFKALAAYLATFE